jgi:hypothetical protein
MLQRGDAVPHFGVRTLGGDMFRYATIWQHKNLVLVTLPRTVVDDGTYVAGLLALGSEFREREGLCVVTRDHLTGLSAPGALVADRWGEIVHVATASDVADLPTPTELLHWLEYVEQRCPECEGEAR